MFKNVTTSFEWFAGNPAGKSWTFWLLPNIQLERYNLAASYVLTITASWLVFSAELDVNWDK